ncbi:Transposase type 1 [Trinorchestia longiramus]|nr:Transposase type 1 [Trinorchestia longiramus]
MGDNQTITSEVYCQQLTRLKAVSQEKRLSLINRKGVILHHDNARPHTSRATKNLIEEFGWEVVHHPPCSPDLAPTDFHLFRSLQNHLMGQRLTSREELGRLVSESACERKDPGSNPAADMVDAARYTAWDLDEKTFSVHLLVNKQNDRIISFGQDISELWNVFTTKHPASVMMLGVVTSNGEKMPPVWFPRGYRLNASAFKDVLVTKILSWDTHCCVNRTHIAVSTGHTLLCQPDTHCCVNRTHIAVSFNSSCYRAHVSFLCKISWSKITGVKVTIFNGLMSNSVMSNSVVSNSVVSNSVMSNSVMSNSVMSNSVMSNSVMSNSVMSNSVMSNNVMSNSVMSNSVMSNSVMSNSVMSNSVMSNSIMSNSVMSIKAQEKFKWIIQMSN